jgi:hypothetical protein
MQNNKMGIGVQPPEGDNGGKYIIAYYGLVLTVRVPKAANSTRGLITSEPLKCGEHLTRTIACRATLVH